MSCCIVNTYVFKSVIHTIECGLFETVIFVLEMRDMRN